MNNESIYLDTNVITDFLLNRDSSAFRLFEICDSTNKLPQAAWNDIEQRKNIAKKK